MNKMLSRFDMLIERKSLYAYNIQQLDVASKLITVYTSQEDPSIMNQSEGIIFSKDRAMQLHALLSSYMFHVKNPVPLHILYMVSNDTHYQSYLEVLEEFRAIIKTAAKQDSKSTFRIQLLNIIRNVHSNKLFFLVDDNMFTEETDLSLFDAMDTRVVIPSLRLGANLKRSYTVNKEQPLPPFYSDPNKQNAVSLTIATKNNTETEELIYWVWQMGFFDWAYPLSVDGHILNTNEILCLIENTEFNSPNTLENNLQLYNDIFKHRMGVCFKKSKLINVPCNRVQSDYENLHGNLHQEELLEIWNNGKCIDFLALRNFQNESAHEETPLRFIDRKL